MIKKSRERLTQKRFFYPTVAFVLTLVMWQVLCIIKQIYPYGPNCMLQIDLFHQYAPFHEELRNRILNGKSLIYSWEGGLGKVFYTQMAYYTTSPLSFLVLLFPTERLPDFILLIVEIKLAFSAFTCADYIQEHFQKRDPYSVLFGLLYVFCGFNLAFYWNVMWLDVVALFPLLALEVDRLIEERKGRRYLVVLAYMIICNFYLAFIACIGIVLYFGVILFSRYSLKTQRKEIIGCIGHFAVTSCLGGGIAMFLIVPVSIGLSQSGYGDYGMGSVRLYDNVWQVLESAFLGAKPQVLVGNDDAPNSYSGILSLLLLPFFFLDKTVQRKEKVLWGCILAFLLACCVFSPLDYLIHGAHYPANLPHRFTFISSFFVLLLSYRALIGLKKPRRFPLAVVASLWLMILLFSEYVIVNVNRDLQHLYSNLEVAANAALLALYAALIWLLYAKPKYRKPLFALLFCVSVGECLYAGINGMRILTDRSMYISNIDPMKKVLRDVEDREDGDFYRTEFRRITTTNDGALYHYNGCGIFSSLLPGTTSKLTTALGLASRSTSFRYYDPTPVINTMFNTKYILEKTDDGNGGMQNPFYQYVQTEDNIEIYQNPDALGLGFLADSSLKDWEVLDSTPFQVQNDFAVKAAGVDKAVFTNKPAAALLPENIEILAQQTPNLFQYFVPDPYDLSKVPSVAIVFPIEEDGYYYLWGSGNGANRLVYFYDEEMNDREMAANSSLFDVGELKGGSELVVYMQLADIIEEKQKYVEQGIVSYYLVRYNEEVFREMHDTLAEAPWQMTGWDDTWLEGTVDANRDGVLFTSVPKEKGWTAYVDGVQTDIVGIGSNALIGVELTEGEHTVRLEFDLPGLKTGICLTVLSLCGTVVYFLKTAQKRKKLT